MLELDAMRSNSLNSSDDLSERQGPDSVTIATVDPSAPEQQKPPAPRGREAIRAKLIAAGHVFRDDVPGRREKAPVKIKVTPKKTVKDPGVRNRRLGSRNRPASFWIELEAAIRLDAERERKRASRCEP